jgi:hypothetical protein
MRNGCERASDGRSAILSPVTRRRPWLSSIERAFVAYAVTLTVAVMAALGGGCAKAMTVEQRSTQGPSAQQMFNYRVMAQTGREPTFEERRQWDEQIEQRISAYLREHPDKANALDVSTFRYLRQPQVGMDKEQVLILLGAPATVSGDQGQMQKLARDYWRDIEGNATEVWVYPLGWNLFFAGQKLVDITQYLPPR